MAVRNGKFQLTGDQQPFGPSPVESPSADPRSGQFQKMGTDLGMSKSPIMSPSANPKSGEFQVIGDATSMSRHGVKGWGSAANLTMSPETHRTGNNAAQRGGRGKRK